MKHCKPWDYNGINHLSTVRWIIWEEIDVLSPQKNCFCFFFFRKQPTPHFLLGHHFPYYFMAKTGDIPENVRHTWANISASWSEKVGVTLYQKYIKTSTVFSMLGSILISSQEAGSPLKKLQWVASFFHIKTRGESWKSSRLLSLKFGAKKPPEFGRC